jgi:putative ABC transport system permease protein
MSILLRMAWRNVWRNWRRSAIVMVAIAVGLFGCLFLISWTRGMVVQMTDSAVRLRLADLAVLAPGYLRDPVVTTNLDPAPVLAAIRGREGVHASPRLVGDGLVQSTRRAVRARIIGVLPDAEAAVSIVPGSLVEGTFLAASEGGRRRLPPLVIGRAMAERLQADIGDKLVVRVPGEGGIGAFRVSGIFGAASSEFEKATAFVSLAAAQRLHEVGERVTEVAIALDPEVPVAELQAELQGALAGGETLEVLRWQEREPRLASVLGMMDSMLWTVYALVFVAMVFGIANVLVMAVYERTREFGVMRSVGLKPRGLLALVLCESLLLTVLGTLLALALAVPVILWLGVVGIDFSLFSEGLRRYGIGTRMYLRLSLDDLVQPVLLAAITAVVAAFWPALRAMRMRPATAVRQI